MIKYASEDAIKEVLATEWYLFTNLNNTDGRAECQDNKEDFYIFRSSQWESLSVDVVHSYLRDLEIAEGQGRNLLFEKYAYMMEYTHNEEYLRLKPYLPTNDNLKNKVIEKIEEIVMKWENEFSAKYPKFSKQTRPLEDIDRKSIAPARVYLIGEHKSYSYTTNLLYLEFIKKIDFNLVEEIFTKIVKKKGFASLEEAEASIK